MDGRCIFLNIIPDDFDMTNILSAIVDEVILVKNSMGQAYLPAFTFNGIGDLNNSEGYQIKLSTPQTLHIMPKL